MALVKFKKDGDTVFVTNKESKISASIQKLGKFSIVILAYCHDNDKFSHKLGRETLKVKADFGEGVLLPSTLVYQFIENFVFDDDYDACSNFYDAFQNKYGKDPF